VSELLVAERLVQRGEHGADADGRLLDNQPGVLADTADELVSAPGGVRVRLHTQPNLPRAFGITDQVTDDQGE
jgi:hypothetical protein